MSALFSYRLRAESVAALLALLQVAQEGKARAFVTSGETGDPVIDGARIVYPWAETEAGIAYLDEETGEVVTPQIPTGDWLCEVLLTEPDAELGAIAV
ncbi:hypothetical protein [Parvibaculum sp.]|uniref:hypothetical protein n=1 Tax=Parvibaculum sp. TaxID=2024848 RepID=UPI003BAAE956